MAETGLQQSQRRNKKKAAANASGGHSTEAPDGTLGSWRLLSGAASRPGSGHGPAVLLPSKELRRLGLSAGDVLQLRAPNGRQTIAACEVGGREGGLLLTSSALLSLGADVGDEILLTSDFEALEAGEVDIEAPRELFAAWPAMTGGLQVDRYLKAVLDGALLFAGDVRLVSLNGRAWRLRVPACRGRSKASSASPSPANASSAPADVWAGPWLVDEKTRLRATAELPSAGSSASSKAPVAGEATGFGRIGGLRSIVEELREAVQLPLQNPQLYRQIGVTPPRGVLLYGPPGTGKTLLAKSLAEELQCPCELLAATDLVGTGIGESEERIKATFERCRQQAEERGTGALLFIDEVDAVCPKRDDAGEAERRMVAAFLTALDGAQGGDGIVVLGATNRPDAIDSALRRAGRLEREIEVGVPNAEERLQILEVCLAGIRHSLEPDERRELARKCHGYVGADLRALCNSAARLALRSGKELVDLESCLDAARLVPPSALKELLVEVPEVRWADIGGYQSTKEALREAVEWPIRHAWAFEAMRIEPPRGVLLYGPPGCSKTMMAKAVATETEMNFVSVKGPELFSKYVGDSERAVREVFRKARTAAPCVVFFDEVDALGASREGGEGAGGVAARVLAQLLAEMDGVGAAAGGARRHVVVLAATNRPHALDPALMRPGRFDRLVHVPLPDEPARRAIFQSQLARMRASADLDAPELAGRTAGYSGAEVVMVCREAALQAIRDALEAGGEKAEPCACLGHFEQALKAVQPRITAETARFYEDFEKSIQQS